MSKIKNEIQTLFLHFWTLLECINRVDAYANTVSALQSNTKKYDALFVVYYWSLRHGRSRFTSSHQIVIPYTNYRILHSVI